MCVCICVCVCGSCASDSEAETRYCPVSNVPPPALTSFFLRSSETRSGPVCLFVCLFVCLWSLRQLCGEQTDTVWYQ